MEKSSVLFLDDEERIIKSLRLIFLGRYKVLTATNAEDALDLIANNSIDVVVSDQRMPGITGVEFLDKVRILSPKSIRILLTGYSDLDAIMDAVNKGEVFRYIQKPWNNDALKRTIELGVEAARKTAQTIGTSPDTASTTAETDTQFDLLTNVLLLDEHAQLYLQIKDLFKSQGMENCTAFHANSIDTALNILKNEAISIIISDIKIGQQDVSYLLKVLKTNFPQVVTIITSDVRDAEITVDLINEGQIFRYLPKRLPSGMLKMTLQAAIRHHQALLANPELHHRYQTEEVVTDQNDTVQKGIWSAIKGLGKRLFN
jgi:serine/threonine-protein kinase